MQLRHSWPIAVALFALLGCDGDDDGPTTPTTVSRDQVAGIYTVTELSFDPQGVNPSEDILARLDAALLPQLVLSRTGDDAQLSFRDPTTGLLRSVSAAYTLMQNGVRVTFPASDSVAPGLLFPGVMNFAFQDTPDVALRYDQTVSVPLARLRQLVPELQDEPLSDPVPGRLVVTFTLDQR